MNLRWAPSPELIKEADEAPWDAPGARALRRLSYDTQARTTLTGTLMFGLAGVAAVVVATQVHRGQLAMVAIAAFAAIVAVSLGVALLLLDPKQLMQFGPPAALLTIPLAGASVTAALVATKNEFAALTILYAEAPIYAFYMFRRWAATLLVVLVATEYAVGLVWIGGSFWSGFTQWFVVVSTVVALGPAIGTWAARAEDLSHAERAARDQLADLNATLERRVDDQVAELTRLSRMRRFLSPQVADAVVSEGDDDLLKPHRCRVAVLFVDLRGFTAFTNRAEPEEVVQALDEYYQAVGEVLRAHDATIGGYAGDGIMAYFGDPVPRQAPAQDAIAAVTGIAQALDVRRREWARRGHDLGYGIGLAFGYATLGVVGFDGRYDYTPLGAVVNLAARLCAKASDGQVLVDHAMYLEIEDHVSAVAVDGYELKGFEAETRVYSVSL
jgi:class 3 adenylate cyclase